MIKTLIAGVLFAASGTAFAGLDNINSDALHLYKRTIRSVEVVTAIEGESSASTGAYASTMRRWVAEGLKQNGFVIDPASMSAPDIRFGGYCGKAVNGCSLKVYVSRDLWYGHPDGSVHRLPSRDVADDKVSKEGAAFSQEEMYPLFVEMLTRFVEAVERSEADRAVSAN